VTFWHAIAALALLAGTSSRADAQGPSPTRWPSALNSASVWRAVPARLAPQNGGTALLAPQQLLSASDSTTIPPTHWKQGALIGGGALGLLGALTFVSLCSYDGPCHNPALFAVGGFALFGLVGFGVGALIGGQFPMGAP